MTLRSSDSRRRRPAVLANVLVQVLLAVLLVLLANFWSFRHAWRHHLARDPRYALQPATVEFLRELPRPVEVIALYRDQRSARGQLEQRILKRALRTIEEFQIHAPDAIRIVADVNVSRDPAAASAVQEDHDIEEFDRIYLLSGDRREVLRPEDLARIHMPPPTRPDLAPRIASERIAESLVEAMRRVITSERPRVLFTQGHGEIPIDRAPEPWSVGELRTSLEARGYRVEGIDLRTALEIPDDTALVVTVAAGPEGFQPLRDDARRALDAYHRRGGALLTFLPRQGATGLEPLLAARGIAPRSGVVTIVGPVPGQARAVTTYLQLRSVNESHPAVRGLAGEGVELEVVDYRALALEAPAVPLVSSGAGTWLEEDPRHLQRDADDPRGPFPLVAAVDRGAVAGDADGADIADGDASREIAGRWVVFGSWTTAIDPGPRLPGFFQGGARRLVLGCVNWLTDQPLPEVGGGRMPEQTRVVFTDEAARLYFWMAIAVLPLLPLVAGIVVFAVRRRR